MAADESGAGAARARLFRLLAHIVDRGLDPRLRELLGGLPELADLARPGRSVDDDAADHHDLFGFRVPPFSGLFLEDDARVGGPATDAVIRHYANGGWSVPTDDRAPDHLATELSFLAHCAENGLDRAAAEFLDGHVLGWVPSLVAAIRREPFEDWVGLSAVLHEAIVEYRLTIDVDPVRPPQPAPADDLLARPETGVREIAEHLSTPARSGLFVGRGDVMRLGRSSDTPRGFGGRAVMLANLLRSAAEYDRLDEVVERLDAIAAQTAAVWSMGAYSLAGALPDWAGIRTARIESTRAMLGELADRVRRAAAQDEADSS